MTEQPENFGTISQSDTSSCNVITIPRTTFGLVKFLCVILSLEASFFLNPIYQKDVFERKIIHLTRPIQNLPQGGVVTNPIFCQFFPKDSQEIEKMLFVVMGNQLKDLKTIWTMYLRWFHKFHNSAGD